jgi:hypothetical protein
VPHLDVSVPLIRTRTASIRPAPSAHALRRSGRVHPKHSRRLSVECMALSESPQPPMDQRRRFNDDDTAPGLEIEPAVPFP